MGFEAEAVSIGIAKIVGSSKPIASFYREFKPIQPVDAEAFAHHDLSNQKLSKMSQFQIKDAMEINEILQNCKACFAHNSSFDKQVLDNMYRFVGMSFLPFMKLQCTQ